jgi:hypothetical protein
MGEDGLVNPLERLPRAGAWRGLEQLLSSP